MKKSSGKIENVSVEAVYSIPIVGLINNPDSSSILASYEASSLTTYMDVGGNKFLPTNLSNVPTIYQMTAPVTWGNSIFKTVNEVYSYNAYVMKIAEFADWKLCVF